MKILSSAGFVLALGLTFLPALASAQSTAAPVPGSQAVPGEGPGGSGTGQSTKGLGKDGAGAMGSMKKQQPGMTPDGDAMNRDGTKTNGSTVN